MPKHVGAASAAKSDVAAIAAEAAPTDSRYFVRVSQNTILGNSQLLTWVRSVFLRLFYSLIDVGNYSKEETGADL